MDVSVKVTLLFSAETEELIDAYRGALLHKIEGFTKSELNGKDVALSVAVLPGIATDMRYFDAYDGGHGHPIRVSARTERDAREVLRRKLGRRRLRDKTVLVDVTTELIQGTLF